MTPLLLHGLAPLHWAVAGAGIAIVTLLLLFLGNRRLGISTGFEDLCSLAVSWPYFQRSAIVKGRTWRLPLLAGLVMGGWLSAVMGGGWSPTWDLGRFDQVVGWGPVGKLAWMFVGGLFIGFGTRLGGGCTSGHGIFGLSNFEWPSLVTVAAFFSGGIIMTNLVYGLVF